MSNLPIVTVIIPTYNHAHFLRDALQSLCAQTYTNWEAIVVNNFSEDDTVAVVESFDDPRIRLENFRNNGIIAASRNRGIALARGRYLAFLDSDDIWHPEKLAKCMPHFVHDVGLVSHGLHWFGDQERDFYCGPEKRATFDALLNGGNCITPSATMVKKNLLELVGCFSEDPSIVTSEDYHLWIKLAKAGICMHFIKEVLGDYRVHAGNQSGSVIRHLNSVLCVVNEFLPATQSNNFMMKIRLRKRYCLAYYGAGRAMQHNGQYIKSWPLFLRAIIYFPFFLKNYIALLLGLILYISVNTGFRR
ncbi:MAG: glycosyltransferase [Methylotenera sp.]|nr:glycosyltransferase [Methylotenera sp.]MDD4925331.1 glycosyltransferase [Methylotenera sp.]